MTLCDANVYGVRKYAGSLTLRVDFARVRAAAVIIFLCIHVVIDDSGSTELCGIAWDLQLSPPTSWPSRIVTPLLAVARQRESLAIATYSAQTAGADRIGSGRIRWRRV